MTVVRSLARNAGGPAVTVVQETRAMGNMVERVIFATDAAQPAGTRPFRRLSPDLLPEGAEDVRTRIFKTRPPYGFGLSPGLWSALREVIPRADLVTIHSIDLFPQYAAFTTALNAGIPYILSPHGALDPWLACSNQLIKRLTKATWQRRMLANAAAIHFTTDEEANLAGELMSSAPRIVVPNGLDLSRFATDRPERAFRDLRLNGHDGPIVLFLGRIADGKGIDLLIRAFARAPHDGLLVIGGPDEGIETDLKRLAGELGIADAVRFVGPVYGSDQLDALAAADVWALTSHTDDFGEAVVEAMAAGCPVLISSEVNLASQVRGAAAGVVTSLDVDDIATALRSLLTEPAQRAELSAAGRRFAQRFDWSIIAPALVRAYTRVAQGSGPGLLNSDVQSPASVGPPLPSTEPPAGELLQGPGAALMTEAMTAAPDLGEATASKRRNRLIALLQRGPALKNVGAAVAAQGALIVSGPLSARMLGPANRGYLAIISTFASTIGQIGGLGISIAATYYLASRRLGGRDIVRLLRGSALAQVSVLSLIYAIAIFSYVAIKDAPIVRPVCISLLQLPAVIALDYGIAFALGARQHGVASILRALPPALFALEVLVIYLDGGRSLDAVVIALSASSMISGALALFLGLRAAYSVHPDESLLSRVGFTEARRQVLRFGRRGYVGLLSPTDTLRIDQLLIGFLLAPRVVGIYAVGAALTTFTRIIGVNIGMSATTEVAHRTELADQRLVVEYTLRQAAAIIGAVTIVVGLALIVLIPLLFGDTYRSAVPIAEFLLVATGLLAMKRVAVDLMRGAGEPSLGTRAEVINVALFLILGTPAALILGSVAVAACLACATGAGFFYLARQMHRHGFLGKPRPHVKPV